MSIIKQVYVVTRSLEHGGTSAKSNVSISKSIKSATSDVDNARSNTGLAESSFNAAQLAYEGAKLKRIEAINNEDKFKKAMSDAREKYEKAKLNYEELARQSNTLSALHKKVKIDNTAINNSRMGMSMAQASFNAAKLAYEGAKAKKIEAIKNEKKLEENMTTAREKYKKAKSTYDELVSRKNELTKQKNTLYSSLRKTVSVGPNTYLVKRDRPKNSK